MRETDAAFAGSLVERSRQLKQQVSAILKETGADKVDILAHSMGGLDARRMIVDEGMADRVATLTTIGTPHDGTALADFALGIGGRGVIAALAPMLDLEGFKDLTRDACQRFNEHARNAEATNSVRYRVVTASEDLLRTSPLLQAAWIATERLAGSNDGVVPTTSQDWENMLIAPDGRSKRVQRMNFPMPADHLNEIGWWDPNEFFFSRVTREAFERRVRDFYLRLATTE